MTTESTPSSKGPGIARVRALVFIEGPTKNSVALRWVFEALGKQSPTAPTHGSFDDRTRAPFDAGALATEGEAKGGMAWLWRQARPRYFGSMEATPQLIARASLEYDKILEDDVAPVCHALAALVEEIHPAYAAVHFAWTDDGTEQTRSLRGIAAKALEYRKHGPPGVYAWTWLGPELARRFTLPVLESVGGRPTPWGGVRLALDEQPWALPFEELRARQTAVDAVLRPLGIFGNYEGVAKKGPNWIPIPNNNPT